jgi:hypothetical protein
MQKYIPLVYFCPLKSNLSVLIMSSGQQKEGMANYGKVQWGFSQDHYGSCEGLEMILNMANEALIRAEGGH